MVALVLGALLWYGFRTLRIGYIDSAIVRLRALVAAEAVFAKAHPDKGYTCTISELPQDELVARLIRNGIDNGYSFEISGCQGLQPEKPNTTFHVVARPLRSGLPAFCSDSSGLVKSDNTGSVESCMANGIANE